MKKVIVVGLNNFGMEIARQFTRSGATVMAIDKNKSQIEKISPDVAHTLLLNVFEIAQLEKVRFGSYDAIVVNLSENMELTLSILILMKSMAVKNVYVCVENVERELLAEVFIKNSNWSIIRLDKQVASLLLSMITDSQENKNPNFDVRKKGR